MITLCSLSWLGVLFIPALIYDDDDLLASDSIDLIQFTKPASSSKFTIKDLGSAKYFLGIELYRTARGMYLNQKKYIYDINKDVGILEAYIKNPFPPGLKLLSDFDQSLHQLGLYRRTIVRLLC